MKTDLETGDLIVRKLTDHIVKGKAHIEEITVLDEPGQGNACHEYRSATLDDIRELLTVSFQNGPIQEFGVNGTTNEALIAIVIDRMRSFQSGNYACRENALALTHLETALMWLQKRTRDRIARNVEGTHKK